MASDSGSAHGVLAVDTVDRACMISGSGWTRTDALMAPSPGSRLSFPANRTSQSTKI